MLGGLLERGDIHDRRASLPEEKLESWSSAPQSNVSAGNTDVGV